MPKSMCFFSTHKEVVVVVSVKPEGIVTVCVAFWQRQVEVTVSLLTWTTVILWRLQNVHLKLISMQLIIFIDYDDTCFSINKLFSL